MTRLLVSGALVAALALGGAGLGGAGEAHATALNSAELERLALLASDNEFVVQPHPLVLAQVHDLIGTPGGRSSLSKALAGMAQYEVMVMRALDTYDLPPQLAAVPLIESGYRNVREPAGKPEHLSAAGLWQFIPGTARAYGLRVDGEVDQRMNPEAQTRAAARMFADLYADQGDWALALASYNMGQGRVDRAVAETGERDPWTLMEQGRINTYAARVMAAALILENAEALGL